MISEEELYDMYCVHRMNQSEIAEKIGVTSTTISNWIEKYGIEKRTRSEARLDGISVLTREKLHYMYWAMGMSQLEIAEKIGVNRSTVYRWMRRYGIESRTISESRFGRQHRINPFKPSRENLYDMYCVQWMSLSEIAEEIDVSISTVSGWMKEYGIESRTYSDFSGENASRWEGGISFELYCFKFDNLFKELVRERDDYTCQLCGFKQNGRKLDVHHIHYDKDNCYPDVVALCRSCHSKVNCDRDYWEEYFENQLIERGLYYWNISESVA